MPDTPKIREVSFEDYQQVASLAARYGLEFESYDEWKHLLVNSPAYRQFQAKWPIGWVLETCSRQIVGYIGNIPLAYELEGKRLIAATARAGA